MAVSTVAGISRNFTIGRGAGIKLSPVITTVSRSDEPGIQVIESGVITSTSGVGGVGVLVGVDVGVGVSVGVGGVGVAVGVGDVGVAVGVGGVGVAVSTGDGIEVSASVVDMRGQDVGAPSIRAIRATSDSHLSSHSTILVTYVAATCVSTTTIRVSAATTSFVSNMFS